MESFKMEDKFANCSHIEEVMIKWIIHKLRELLQEHDGKMMNYRSFITGDEIDSLKNAKRIINSIRDENKVTLKLYSALSIINNIVEEIERAIYILRINSEIYNKKQGCNNSFFNFYCNMIGFEYFYMTDDNFNSIMAKLGYLLRQANNKKDEINTLIYSLENPFNEVEKNRMKSLKKELEDSNKDQLIKELGRELGEQVYEKTFYTINL